MKSQKSEKIRLQKFLSQLGIASRRKAEQLILQERITINGKVAVLGDKVDPSVDKVKLDGKPITNREVQRLYFKLYKPPGYITSLSDPQGRPTIKDLISDIPAKVYPVGRLDFNSEGLLLLTNDGELAHRLMHPSYRVPRVYHVKLRGTPPPQKLQKLVSGVKLEDGIAKAVYVEKLRITEKGGNLWFEMMLQEGRNREIRRMCEAIGYKVSKLIRVQYGTVSLDDLYPGQYEPLTEKEIQGLRQLVELDE